MLHSGEEKANIINNEAKPYLYGTTNGPAPNIEMKTQQEVVECTVRRKVIEVVVVFSAFTGKRYAGKKCTAAFCVD